MVKRVWGPTSPKPRSCCGYGPFQTKELPRLRFHPFPSGGVTVKEDVDVVVVVSLPPALEMGKSELESELESELAMAKIELAVPRLMLPSICCSWCGHWFRA